VDEEVRLEAAHRLVDAVSAEAFVDAPALAGLVAGEGEHDLARLQAGCPEAANHRLAQGAGVGEAVESHAVEVRLARLQTGEVEARGEVAVLQSRRADKARGVPHRRSGRELDDHARGPVGSAPDQRAAVGHIAAHHAERQLRSCTLGRDDRGRYALREDLAKPAAQQRAGAQPLQ